MPLHCPVIVQDARPDIVDALLTLISVMGQGACHLPFYLSRQPILPHWMDATQQPSDCWVGTTVNRWRSIDAHLRAHLGDILTVIRCSTIVHKMHIIFIGSQYTVSLYSHLHPKALRHLSFWATTINVIWMMNDISPLRYRAFGRQFMAEESMH